MNFKIQILFGGGNVFLPDNNSTYFSFYAKLFNPDLITRLLISLCFIYFLPGVQAQDTTRITLDSSKPATLPPSTTYLSPESTRQPNKSRIWWVSVAHVALYGGSLLILNETWYKNYPKQGFTSFDDSKEWLQMDKIGHAWSAYTLSLVSTNTWKWAGLSDKKSAIIGSASGFAFLTVIELLDAHSSGWGWSWSDVAANSLGTGLFLSQELLWKEQRIQFKFSFHRKNYVDETLNMRSDELFGSTTRERMLKDYNGQTYWLSIDMDKFIRFPKWLNFAVGYGAEGMVYARDEQNIEAGYPPAYRQYYLSIDFDLRAIKSRSKVVNTLIFFASMIKIPAPTIEFSPKGTKVYAFYF